jgi:hypothetical protein
VEVPRTVYLIIDVLLSRSGFSPPQDTADQLVHPLHEGFIKDQLRQTNVKTTVDFYIGSDMDYQREQLEKLILNSGKR